MSDNASSTFIGDNTHGSTLNQGSIITGDGSHVGNINHFHTATQEDSARKSCLRDLLAALGDDPDDYRQMLEDRKGPKTLGTCEWVSETDAYKSWIAKSSSLLWISGDAGKGKTMLSLHLVSTLKGDSSTAHVVHFFCSRDHGKNNGASILRGLIYQLLSQRPSLFEHVTNDYDKHGASLFDDRKFQALWTIFTRMLHDQNITSITCIMDGLDECDEEGLEDFWVKIKSLYDADPERKVEQSSHHLKLLVVSRNHPYSIKQAMHAFPRLRLEPDNEPQIGSDISKFIDDRMADLRCPSETYAYIKEKLSSGSEGTYLWVSFAISSLRKVRVIDMESTVDAFPRGLDAMYRRMLLMISKRERGRVIEILRWVIASFRPLTLRELAVAVNTNPARGQTPEEAISDEVTYAGDLLTMDKKHWAGEQVVSLVHSSVLDFLRSIPQDDDSLESFGFQATATHAHLAHRLFDYTLQSLLTLAPSEGESTNRESPVPFEEKDYPLLKYALAHGVRHVLQIGKLSLIGNHHRLLDPAEQYHVLWLQHTYLAMHDHWPRKRVTVAHLAASQGLTDVLDYLHTEQDTDINVQDGDGRTLLFYATHRYQLETMGWLLIRGADPNAHDVTGQTALHIAADKDLDFVDLLLHNGAKVLVRSSTQNIHSMNLSESWHAESEEGITEYCGTPLHIAASRCDDTILGRLLPLFLQEGGSSSEVDGNGRTMLHWIATCVEDDWLVKPIWDLLEQFCKPPQTIDPSILDNNGEAAIHIAMRKLFSWSRSDKPTWNPWGQSYKAGKENANLNSVIRLLVTFRTPIDIRTSCGRTLLHMACKFGNLRCVEFLLERGADASIYDGRGRTALHWLCSEVQIGLQNRPRILHALVKHMTLEDIKAKDADGKTAFELAEEADIDYVYCRRRVLRDLLPLNLQGLVDDIKDEYFETGNRGRDSPPWKRGSMGGRRWCANFAKLHPLIEIALFGYNSASTHSLIDDICLKATRPKVPVY
ncbi:hypothetical protein J4E85_011657 [Alternaria conjuncta]|uniref:uncharacterized protein n=1 Tax=Alternaria conjuncta TaxID=181017 RepID=UPI002220FA7A|nr:uncharacterized protein J4E85_011657 [Alternaria conjuncta]KAI4909005.1 hypothetical protein J4E85_011657 [Alternaria conjuncta]